jgi:Rrf2 family protein
VKFSTKVRYGIRAMLEIALNQSEDIGVFQKDIAINQDLSVKYLDHIIHSLKVARLISNTSGRKSGYKLTREPENISILDIHNAFEPGICVIDCMSDAVKCSRSHHCAAKGFWGGLNNLVIKYFASKTLQDLLDDQSLIDDQVN